MAEYRIGVDIGGTFTDIALLRDDGAVFSKKVLSTPADYSAAIQSGIEAFLPEIGVSAADIRSFAHGTTVVTNTIIERKGANVALVTTRGFRDVLELGRFRAPKLYDLTFRKPEPLVGRRLRFEVSERILASGEIRTPLNEDEVAEVARKLADEPIAAIAVCFLHSYVNPEHESRAADILRRHLPGVIVTASHEINPQMQEYERTSTTVVNAYVRPTMEAYVERLGTRLEVVGIRAPIMVMQSSGGMLPAAEVARNPVFAIESGPAAGVVGASLVGSRSGYGDLIVLDMGGTTAKAALIDGGNYVLAPEIEVGSAQAASRLVRGAGYIVQTPTIDIAEVGSGGGSIAWLDEANALKVGPESAGSSPGPACYGIGGTRPTVTDANVLLGYLNPGQLVGGELAIDAKLSERVIGDISAKLGLEPIAAAYGIHLLANANIMRALRSISSERGRDPRDFTLFAIGGNGPLHGPGLAEELGVGTVIVPPVAGVFSALGLIASRLEYQRIFPFYHPLRPEVLPDMEKRVREAMENLGRLLSAEGYQGADRQDFACTALMQYAGQSGSIPVDVGASRPGPLDADAVAEAFHDEHERIFGYRSDKERIQIVSLKVTASGIDEEPALRGTLQRTNLEQGGESVRSAYFGPVHGWMETRVTSRPALSGAPSAGPIIVEEYDSTTVVPPGWQAALDGSNNLVLTRVE